MASAKKTAAEATQTIEAIAADTQKAAKEQFEKLSEGFEKMTTFGQENIDAMVKSSEVATKAAEGFGAQSTKFNDMFAASAKDVASPLNARVGAASEAMKSFTA